MVLVAFSVMINVPRNLKNGPIRNLMSLQRIFMMKFKNDRKKFHKQRDFGDKNKKPRLFNRMGNRQNPKFDKIRNAQAGDDKNQDEDKRQIICYTCDQPGHKSFQCPLKDNNGSGKIRGRTVYKTGQDQEKSKAQTAFVVRVNKAAIPKDPELKLYDDNAAESHILSSSMFTYVRCALHRRQFSSGLGRRRLCGCSMGSKTRDGLIRNGLGT